MRTHLSVLFIPGIMLAGCQKAPDNPTSAKTYPAIIFMEEPRVEVDGKRYEICWGETWAEGKHWLSFVLFEQNAPSGHPNRVLTKPDAQWKNEGWLVKPDGTKIQLPTDVQLHEIIGGQYRQRQGRVTTEQLKAFLASKPKEYTVDALLRFVGPGTHPASTSAVR